MILSEYLKTVFITDTHRNEWPSDFHIITAYNPKRVVTEAENLAADNRLRAQLEAEQVEHFRIVGDSGDLMHREASWGVIGINLEHAIRIGLLYVQNAIFEVRDGELFVVSCDTLERCSLGKFCERVKNYREELRNQDRESKLQELSKKFRKGREHLVELIASHSKTPLHEVELRIKASTAFGGTGIVDQTETASQKPSAPKTQK
jgi:hypothetical protein